MRRGRDHGVGGRGGVPVVDSFVGRGAEHVGLIQPEVERLFLLRRLKLELLLGVTFLAVARDRDVGRELGGDFCQLLRLGRFPGQVGVVLPPRGHAPSAAAPPAGVQYAVPRGGGGGDFRVRLVLDQLLALRAVSHAQGGAGGVSSLACVA